MWHSQYSATDFNRSVNKGRNRLQKENKLKKKIYYSTVNNFIKKNQLRNSILIQAMNIIARN